MVISDLHAGRANGSDTYIPSEPPTARPKLHPLNDLVNLVDEQSIKVDYLVVPGDISNRADASGLAYAWTKIQQLARSLGAEVVAAPGNHDVVTREPVDDPRESLKQLLPSFPSGNTLSDNHFWQAGYCIVEHSDHRFVLVDSTDDFPEHPGTFADEEQERAYWAQLNQGGIRDETIAALEQEIASMEDKLNILVCHHHPIEHQLRRHMVDWNGAMRNGSELISLLSSMAAGGRWLVIHGHKHIPQLVQDVRTSATGPVVFCAASLGHHLWAPVTSFIQNQFHLVEVRNDRVPKVGTFSGRISTFNWGFSVGWKLAPSDAEHLPPSTGFGYVADPTEMAEAVREHMMQSDLPILRIEEIKDLFPMLEYLAPRDRMSLAIELRRRNLTLETDDWGNIYQIAASLQDEGAGS